MILIIGGAYQGKLDFAMEKFAGYALVQCELDAETDEAADVGAADAGVGTSAADASVGTGAADSADDSAGAAGVGGAATVTGVAGVAGVANDATVLSAADALAQADSAKPCIYNSIHLLILSQMRKGIDPQAYFSELLDQGKLQNAVLICDDISSGVVPIDKEMRLWRDATGMVMGMLSKHSEQVYRLFAGIASQLK
jgi:adenosyl cobinamide kinase/adenosyl cobinamide phosphate guanylyltransferase